MAVEVATAVPRARLRPDLYPEQTEASRPVEPVDAARAQLYLLLSNLVLNVPDEALLGELAQLSEDEGTLGPALAGLGRAAGIAVAEKVSREHFELFIGVGRGELLPYGSYYLTGFLYERPLVRVRGDLRRLRLERGEGLSEPEDHIGILLETMAGILTRRFAVEPEEEKRFFTRHIAPWAERFFEDLAEAQAARFYRAVGRLGADFIKLEREAFALDDEPGQAASMEGAEA